MVKGALASRRNALIINWDFSMSYFAFYSSSKYHFTKDHTFQISSSTFIDGSDILPIKDRRGSMSLKDNYCPYSYLTQLFITFFFCLL